MVDYGKYSDEELSAFLKRRDRAAFTEIYDRYWAVMYAHAKRMLRDEDEAKDVLQDIFTDIWKRADQINFSGTVKAYLYTAVRNRIIKLVNRGKLMDAFVTKMCEVTTELVHYTDHQVQYNDFKRVIEKEIANLPPKMRHIFEKSHHEAMTNKEIAAELNLSEHTVKTTVFRALNVLRTKLASLLSLLMVIAKLLS